MLDGCFAAATKLLPGVAAGWLAAESVLCGPAAAYVGWPGAAAGWLACAVVLGPAETVLRATGWKPAVCAAETAGPPERPSQLLLAAACMQHDAQVELKNQERHVGKNATRELRASCHAYK